MLNLTYLESQIAHEVDFSRISPHVVQVLGSLPFDNKGFKLSRIGKNDSWDYSGYKTLYRQVEGGLQFSDDESVYVEPQKPGPIPEEPYIPTLEEVKVLKLQEITTVCEQVIYSGVDVALPNGTEHFSLTEKDQINLFGKQAQMAAGAEKLEYHQDGYPCRYYTAEEMQLIIETALGFVTYQTTYCNALNMWIKGAKNIEEVNEITYGCYIPEEYQSEVLKDLLEKMG